MKKYLFYTDTPLQIFHATLIAKSISEEAESSLMICCQFDAAKRIGSLLRDKKIFHSISYVQPVRSSLVFYRTQICSFLGLESLFKSYNEKFDVLALACPTLINTSLFISLKKANKNLEVILFDDGTGSYTGAIFCEATYLGKLPEGIPPMTGRTKLYRKLFSNLPVNNSYVPNLIFLRQPQEITYKPAFKKRFLPFSSELVKNVEMCFGACNLPNNSVLFLDPLRTGNYFSSGEKAIDSLIEKCLQNKIPVSLREHPRSNRHSLLFSSINNCSGGLWEISCCSKKMDNLILVGAASSSQLSPVLENGATPVLIFLQEIFLDSVSEASKINQDKIVSIAKSLYFNKGKQERVIIPKSLDEALSSIVYWSNKFLEAGH